MQTPSETHPSASPAASATSADLNSSRDPRFGVLFVHGMGDQERGDTLLGFGEPVVKFLRSWVREEPRKRQDDPSGTEPKQATGTDPFKTFIDLHDVEAIRVLGTDPDVPAHTTIQVKGRKDLLPWLVAESWWASDFKPAKFTDVLNWGIRVVPFVLFDTARYQLKTLAARRPVSPDEPREQDRVNISNVGQFVFTVVTGPIFYALLLLLLPVATIPFLRRVIGNLMVRLARSVGDPYLLLSSPIRLASMVERIHHDIRWLQDQGCTGIAVVAHSQGAAVAHHALRSFALAEYDLGRFPARKVPITRFITLGAAIEKLHFLQQIDMRGKNLLRGGMLQGVFALAVLVSLLFAWQIPRWGSNWGWLRDRGWWNGSGDQGHWWTLGLWVLFTALFWLGPRLLEGLLRIQVITYKEPTPTDLWNRDNLDMSTATWVDLYARADPVSLGPIQALNPEDGPRHPLSNPASTSAEIRNQDSILFDHTTYFENISQFMVPLVGGLCIDSGWTEILDFRQPLFRKASQERSRRLDWLNVSFAIIAATVTVASVMLLVLGRLDEAGVPLKRTVEFAGEELTIPLEGIARNHIGDGQVAEAVLGILSMILAATAYHLVLVKGAWQAWDAGKSDTLLKQRSALQELGRGAAPHAQEALLGPFTAGAGRFILFTTLAPLIALVTVLIIALR